MSFALIPRLKEITSWAVFAYESRLSGATIQRKRYERLRNSFKKTGRELHFLLAIAIVLSNLSKPSKNSFMPVFASNAGLV